MSYFYENIYPKLDDKKLDIYLNEFKKELTNILSNDNVTVNISQNIKKLLFIIPELSDMLGFKHNHPHHHLDVWNHTLLALSMSENDFMIRLVLLLHDIGKPHSYQDDEVRHFKGHPEVSSKISRNILERLKYDKEFIDEVCYLIEKHDSVITKEEIENNYDLEYRRYKIQYCDALAHHPHKLEKRKEYLEKTKLMFKNKIKVK